MMNFTCNRRHPLHRDGTNQYQQLLDALRPDFAPIDARSMREMLAFVVDYASKVQYYDLTNQPALAPEHDWTAFFDPAMLGDPKNTTDAQWEAWYNGIKGELEPHLALFFGFLELFKYCQEHLNTLTKRHLDFYYREILALPVRPPKPDEIHVLLELAQNVKQHRLEVGSIVEAGKDASGKALQYGLTREIVVNAAKISDISAVFVDHRDGFGEKVYAAPIANSKDGQGAKLEGNEPKWRPFGQRQRNLAADKRTMVEAQPGWVITSPILALAGGERKLDVSLHLQDLDLGALASFNQFTNSQEQYFELHLSTDAGWYAPEWDFSLEQPPMGLPFIRLTNITIPKSAPAITVGKPDQLGGDFGGEAPSLRFRLKLTPNFLPYRVLANAKIDHIDIRVEVTGLQQLDLRSESTPFTAGRPFMPFGTMPVPDDRLFVGCPEAMTKRLEALSLDVDWVDLPADLTDHYAAYGTVNASDFKVNAALLWAGNWLPLQAATSLFPTGAQSRLNFMLPGSGFFAPGDFGNYAKPLPATTPIPAQTYGYIRLNLNGPVAQGLEAFGHKEYSPLQMRRVMELSHHLMNPATTTEPVLPNPPYTPNIRSLSLNYSASETIEAGAAYHPHRGSMYHLEPFGNYLVNLAAAKPGFLPDFGNEAYAYLGLENAVPGTLVSMLFQFAEGSGNNWLDMRGMMPEWQYLVGNDWKPLDKMFRIYDSTDNLLNTGIVSFSLPLALDTVHTRMGTGKVWLRASMKANSAGIPAAIGIHAQAVKAMLRDNDNDPAHLEQPLGGGTGLRLNPGAQVVKAVTMPYSSFAGVPAETDLRYYTRVSERLRHKQRAIMIWDYERLVLEQFPAIYKVKCISHSSSISEYSPGTVSVIVVPLLRNVNAIDPLRPAVGQGKLADIREYLAGHIPSLFVDLVVENPSYEEILVEFSVGFHPGYDAGYYGQVLNESIKRFLAPWAYEEGQDLVFGGKIHKSAIIKFIEDQPYVDFVVDFLVYHNTNGSNFAGINWMEIECNFIVSAPDVVFVQASSERSVLISANEHRITVLEPGVYPCEDQHLCTTAS